MKTTLSLILLGLLLSSCNAQTENKQDSSEIEVINAVQNWADENDSIPNRVLDQTTINQLRDSGKTINNLKEGFWLEYSIDSTNYNKKAKVAMGSKSFDFELGLKLLKDAGEYIANKRTGKWIQYESFDTKLPISWNRNKTTEYKNGVRNGQEIEFQGYGEEYQRPLAIQHFANGVEDGIGSYYYSNRPYNLRWDIIYKQGIMYVTKQYYESGKMEWTKIDTIINKTTGIYFKQFYENGNLKQSGFFINDTTCEGVLTGYYKNGKIESLTTYKNGNIDGTYKYYYDNGQLWAKRKYSNGKLLEVISNFDPNGKAREKGSLKNGNGTLIMYDDDGNQMEAKEYLNGKPK